MSFMSAKSDLLEGDARDLTYFLRSSLKITTLSVGRKATHRPELFDEEY